MKDCINNSIAGIIGVFFIGSIALFLFMDEITRGVVLNDPEEFKRIK